MTTYYVTLELHATLTDPPGNLTDDDVVQHLEDVLHTLEGAEDVDDPDIIATLATGDVTFTGFVDTDSFDDAARQFSSAVRAAIHASHGATPDWSPDWELLEIQIGASEKTHV